MELKTVFAIIILLMLLVAVALFFVGIQYGVQKEKYNCEASKFYDNLVVSVSGFNQSDFFSLNST